MLHKKQQKHKNKHTNNKTHKIDFVGRSVLLPVCLPALLTNNSLACSLAKRHVGDWCAGAVGERAPTDQHMADWLAVWLAGWLGCWLAGWLDDWLVGWLSGWLSG